MDLGSLPVYTKYNGLPLINLSRRWLIFFLSTQQREAALWVSKLSANHGK